MCAWRVFCRPSEAGGCLFSLCVCLFAEAADFGVQLFSIRANLFLGVYTSRHARAHAFCGPPPHKLSSLIMRRSGGLLSRLGTGDILDAEAGGAVAVQLAPDLGVTIDPGPAEQIAARLDVAVFLSPWAFRRIL